MRVQVNGVRLFFDVLGAELEPVGSVMQKKPTLILLHGGPGFDHAIYRPALPSGPGSVLGNRNSEGAVFHTAHADVPALECAGRACRPKPTSPR